MLARAALGFLIALSIGCGAADVVPVDCKEEHRVGDACAGVPNPAICEDDFCTQGVACAQLIEVDSGASFAAAVASAGAGTCIALAPGRYGAVILPDGVSLLGRSADDVTIDGVETGGDGVVVRGVTIAGGSLQVRAGSTTAEMIRIVSLEDGIVARAGSTLTLKASEVRGYARYGVSAFDVASLNIEDSLIEDSLSGPGLRVQCSGGCACSMTKPKLSMANVRIARTKNVGLSLVGTDATLHNVEVRNTAVALSAQGISVSGCSAVTATDVRIVDNEDIGLLIDDSSMLVDGLMVSGNPLGVWIQRIGVSMSANVHVRSAEITGNRGVGIGVTDASTNVTIEDSRIVDTKELELPVMIGVSAGSCMVANGIRWKDTSHLVLRRVTVSGSQQQSVLIDGGVAPGSLIDHVTLTGGDETTGILQQNFVAAEDLTPEVIASPPVTVTPDAAWPCP